MNEHIKMIFPLDDDDNESLYSEQEGEDEDTIFTLQGYESPNSDSDSEYKLETENLF